MCDINFDCFQGTLTAIRDWFRDYKIPDGKPANRFGLGNKAVNKVRLLHKSLNAIVLNSYLFCHVSFDQILQFTFSFNRFVGCHSDY